jgi:hypothetical protein
MPRPRGLGDRGGERSGSVDVVVAAGYEVVADALELDVEQWDAHLGVMLRGVLVLATGFSARGSG